MTKQILLKMNNQSIGSMIPDAGYLDVRTKVSGTAYIWKFQADLTNCSQAIQQFVDSVNLVR